MTADREIQALVSLLSDEDQDVVSPVRQHILALGERTLPYLQQAWNDNQGNLATQRRIETLERILRTQRVEKRLAQWHTSGQQDLLEGMWVVATYQCPELELDKLRQEMDTIRRYVYGGLGKTVFSPMTQIKIVNHVLFDRLRFRANDKSFYSPSNSLINVALETRKGNPITLSVIYMLVAQQVGIPVYGANLPNLFMLIYKSASMPMFYINPFSRGLTLSRQEVESYLAEMQIPRQSSFFEPCKNIDIIRRALRNLSVAFEKMGERDKAEEVKRLQTDVLGEDS